MNRILILQDIQPAGYPANLKAGYRISGRIFNSLFKYLVLVDYEIIRHFCFPVPYLPHTGSFFFFFTSKQYRKRFQEDIFLKFFELIRLTIQIGMIYGKSNLVSYQITDIKKSPDIRCIHINSTGSP
jgi:hypothetical protein